ncbi:hypothetical protein KBG23_03205 [Candidatus Dojkabacteria bacterium]|nr:hypothetical protein [Candidatus Dojkabacteria bacterium]
MEIFKEDGSYEEEAIFKTEITEEDIRRVELSVENLNYKGEGVTSFSSKYDDQKTEYLNTFGIETEDLDHAEIVTTFIIFSHIDTLKYIEKMGGNLDEALESANMILKDRIDSKHFRRDLGIEIGELKTYEEVRKSKNYSANSDCKVSEEEYAMLLNRILTALSRKNPSKMV